MMILDPDYARFLSKARIIAKMYGYAIAVHGSCCRDLDVVAIPWTAQAIAPSLLVARIEAHTGLNRQQQEPTGREHGRQCWSLLFEGLDPRFVDFSVMPRQLKG